MAAKRFSSLGIGVFSAAMTFLGIILSEIIPKNIGERWNQIIFPIAAIPLQWITAALSPLVWIFERITQPFTSGVSPFTTSEEEISLLTQVGAKEGVIKPYEAEMIRRVFRLNDITAGDIMTPQPFVAFIDGSQTIGQLADFIRSAQHSRFPVFDGNRDNIIGIVHQRDLMRALANGETDRKVAEYSRDAVIVPESRLADELLRDFQEQKSHLAVVVNEYGRVAGIVGLEDVIEELVGEIIDEKDVAPQLIKRISKTEIVAHGQTRIAAINRFFNTDIKSKKTLNGFLLDKFGGVPEAGKVIKTDGLELKVMEASQKQIERVNIIKES